MPDNTSVDQVQEEKEFNEVHNPDDDPELNDVGYTSFHNVSMGSIQSRSPTVAHTPAHDPSCAELFDDDDGVNPRRATIHERFDNFPARDERLWLDSSITVSELVYSRSIVSLTRQRSMSRGSSFWIRSQIRAAQATAPKSRFAGQSHFAIPKTTAANLRRSCQRPLAH